MKKAGKEVPKEAFDGAFHQINMVLETFEKFLAQFEGDFVVNNQPTIADLQLFFEFTNMSMYKQTWEKYPEITKWYNKMLEIPEIKEIQDQVAAHADALKDFMWKGQNPNLFWGIFDDAH